MKRANFILKEFFIKFLFLKTDYSKFMQKSIFYVTAEIRETKGLIATSTWKLNNFHNIILTL